MSAVKTYPSELGRDKNSGNLKRWLSGRRYVGGMSVYQALL
ncbi:hypothetical protein AB9D59_27555 [Blautia producta]